MGWWSDGVMEWLVVGGFCEAAGGGEWSRGRMDVWRWLILFGSVGWCSVSVIGGFCWHGGVFFWADSLACGVKKKAVKGRA